MKAAHHLSFHSFLLLIQWFTNLVGNKDEIKEFIESSFRKFGCKKTNNFDGTFHLEINHIRLNFIFRIQWYKGNERRYNFVISTSTDETNFQDVIIDGNRI